MVPAHGFKNLERHNATSRSPGRETIEKIGPSTLEPWVQSNERAKPAGPETEAEYAERLRGSRRLAYILIGCAFVLYLIAVRWAL